MKQHYFIDKYANQSIAIKIVDFVEIRNLGKM
jgi:hypothetical protein